MKKTFLVLFLLLTFFLFSTGGTIVTIKFPHLIYKYSYNMGNFDSDQYYNSMALYKLVNDYVEGLIKKGKLKKKKVIIYLEDGIVNSCYYYKVVINKDGYDLVGYLSLEDIMSAINYFTDSKAKSFSFDAFDAWNSGDDEKYKKALEKGAELWKKNIGKYINPDLSFLKKKTIILWSSKDKMYKLLNKNKKNYYIFNGKIINIKPEYPLPGIIKNRCVIYNSDYLFVYEKEKCILKFKYQYSDYWEDIKVLKFKEKRGNLLFLKESVDQFGEKDGPDELLVTYSYKKNSFIKHKKDNADE